jgi:hypothetical protein
MSSAMIANVMKEEPHAGVLESTSFCHIDEVAQHGLAPVGAAACS